MGITTLGFIGSFKREVWKETEGVCSVNLDFFFLDDIWTFCQKSSREETVALLLSGSSLDPRQLEVGVRDLQLGGWM